MLQRVIVAGTLGVHHGGRRDRVWTPEATLMLITKIRDVYPRFTGQIGRRRTVWYEIFAGLSPMVCHVVFLSLLLSCLCVFQIVKEVNLRLFLVNYSRH